MRVCDAQVDEATMVINDFVEACRISPESVNIFTMSEVANRSVTYRQANSEGRRTLAKVHKLTKLKMAQVSGGAEYWTCV